MRPARLLVGGAALMITAALILVGCAGNGLSMDVGAMGVVFELPGIIVPIGGSPVDTVVLRLIPEGEGEPMELILDVVDNAASATVHVTPGTWNLEAEVYTADETLVATGTGRAVVLPGTITQVNMHLRLVDGALEIDIEWDDAPPLVVADVSNRPVSVEISGVGHYMVSGLSRIGWDIEVFEFPSNNGRTIKEPGALHYPELAMLYLRSTDSDVESLADWSASGEPRSMTLILEGRGGEEMRINLFEAVVVSANTDTFPVSYDEVEMGGVRIRYHHVELADYTPMFRELDPETLVPHPGQTVEFEGIDIHPGYEFGVLEVPEPGSNPALWFPNLYPGSIAYDWAKEAVDILEEFNSVMRRSMSIINLGADGLEVNRINIFETWPASINLFNPEKAYGRTFLADIYLVGEKAEDG